MLNFKATMSLVGLNQDKRDAIMCKLFIAIICDGAHKWLNNLVPRIITSFTKLAKLFITNYARNKPMRKESHHLFSITQGSDESMEEYMKRFKEEKMEILD